MYSYTFSINYNRYNITEKTKCKLKGEIFLKVAICCLNSKYIHASLAPWCLFSSLKNEHQEIEATVIEATINNEVETIADKIINSNCDIVSFSCYIWNIKKTLEVCKIIKKHTSSTIILGGPEVSYNAKSVLEKNNFIDFVLCGEGEETYPQLIASLVNNESCYQVDGLCYRNNGDITANPEKEYSGTPINPYCDEFFNSLNGRITYIEASRGCPYRCAFCLSGRCSSLRYFDFEQTKDKIIALANSGTKTIKFVDRTFNANSKRANEILDFILDNYKTDIPEDVCFHFEIAGDILTEETLSILEKAPRNLFQLEIGMQSFNEKTLSAINRKTNTSKLIENIKRLISFGNMHIHIDLIAGLPHEDLESFEKSFDIGYSLGANMLQMGFLKLLHGADMRELPDKYPCEFNEEPPYEVTKTPWLTESELEALHNCEDALDRLYNSGRFLYTLDYLINQCGYTPFRLFYDFGNAVRVSNIGLSDYTEKIYKFFESKVDKELLREALICDLLSCSSALQIPEFLKRTDTLYKQVKKHFTEGTTDKIKIAILYKSKRIFAVNQSKPKGFNGRYNGYFYDLNEFNS